MTAVLVFDPAMCCSTGVCGPSVDPRLSRFSADLDWLQRQGVSVERFNLAQQPAAFAEDRAVRAALEASGEAGLPVVKVDGEIKSTGLYPSRAELAAWAGIGDPAPGPPQPPLAAASTAPEATTGGCCAPTASQPGDAVHTSAKPGCCC